MKNRVQTFGRRYRAHLLVIVANAAFALVFLSIAVSWFHQPAPHGIPVGLVGPARAARVVASELQEHAAGRIDLRPVSTERLARVEIEHRVVDGALVLSPRAMTVLTAGAGGTAPKQAIIGAFSALAAHTGQRLSTTDVVPPARNDSQGLSAYFLVLCVLFPSLATGVAAGHLLRRASVSSRLALLVVLAGLSGLGAAWIADAISGLGHYWAIAGIVALFSLAISAPTAALVQITPRLIALCVLAFVVCGIPVSGGPANFAAFGPDFLRWLSPILPLGVGAAALRNTVYFSAGDTTAYLWVLTAFGVTGLAGLGVLAAFRTRMHHGATPLAVDADMDRPLAPVPPGPDIVTEQVLVGHLS